MRDLCPPVLYRLKRALFGWRWFRGRYDTWQKAEGKAAGYGDPSILAKILRSTLEVREGRAAYERDSVLFENPEVDAALLSCLLQVAAENNGRLRVLDFGGSLGSLYWQHRKAISRLADVRWDVVEQPHFVEAGRRFVQNGPLRFFATIDEAEEQSPHDVLLASGVIQYLPTPHAFIEELIAHKPPVIILHNLPLDDAHSNHVRIQHVPPEIYSAKYPVWFFNRTDFLRRFSSHYDVERVYPSPAVWFVGWRDYPSTGLMLRRKPGGALP